MRQQYAHWLAQLSNVLGRETARLELRWMMQAAASPSASSNEQSAVPTPDVAAMVARRLSGEPLQYILGE